MTAGRSSRRGWAAELRDWLRHLAYAGLFFYFLTTYAFQSFEVDGVSMLPLLHDRERIFVNRFVHRFQSIERGDVVVFWYPPSPNKTLVKRVLGIPGDLVSIREGRLFLNGVRIEEPYLPEEYRSTDNLPAVTVPSGYYFVLGDNRKRSDDSRRWGLVPEKYIFGRVVLRFWPLSQFGYIPHSKVGAPALSQSESLATVTPSPPSPSPPSR